MANAYKVDRKWSDRFIPLIKQIVGPRLLVTSPLEVDQKQAADLITIKARNLTIACRIRRAQYYEEYKYQFTVRSHRDSGAETEYSKLVKGWGDWMFYAFALDDTSADLRLWYLIDLAAWRWHLAQKPKTFQSGEIPNGDGTYFAWYDMRSFPREPPLLVDGMRLMADGKYWTGVRNDRPSVVRTAYAMTI